MESSSSGVEEVCNFTLRVFRIVLLGKRHLRKVLKKERQRAMRITRGREYEARKTAYAKALRQPFSQQRHHREASVA